MNKNILDAADIERLVQIVQELTGNQVQEKNYSMLESRLRSRLIKLGLSNTREYWSYFAEHEHAERQVLQGLMTTHYTFFFREYAHFEALEQWIETEAPRLKARHAKDGTPLRLWSAACSRGQEAYSLAMFLQVGLTQRYGVPFEILGTDIDAESVEYARNGVYPIKEVNTIPHHFLTFWKKGTGAIKDFAAVHPKLRERTKFDKQNLLELHTFPQSQKFDVIFARNVFIYFSEENVQKIALDLSNHLNENGLFISGISEPLRFDNWKLVSVGPSCYQKMPPVDAKAAPAHVPGGAPASPPASIPPPQQARYHVLCVDDSPTIQTLIKKIFSEDPLCEKVSVANNGKEAREKLDNGKYDLITLDIHMPIMGGVEFLETQYRKKVDPPVLMVSSVNRTDVDLATKSLALGAFDYVEKPAMNNLKKSVDEILTKAKMALRSRHQIEAVVNAEEFDKSISQKIVVPDASICLRWVRGASTHAHLIEAVIKGQGHEYRSPALVVCVPDDLATGMESLVLGWTQRTVSRIRPGDHFLKPNQIYICPESLESAAVEKLKVNNLSLQLLAEPKGDLKHFARFQDTQVLVDESIAPTAQNILTRSGLIVSDITPATSFASLSLEYFAKLRKAKAA